jgi:hypothetical protein
VDLVVSWLSRVGAEDVTVLRGRDAIRARMPAVKAEAAFGVVMGVYEHPDGASPPIATPNERLFLFCVPGADCTSC